MICARSFFHDLVMMILQELKRILQRFFQD